MNVGGGAHWIDRASSSCGRMIGLAGRVASWLIMSPTPGWRNGIRGRLKPVCPKGHRGSTPLSGTFVMSHDTDDILNPHSALVGRTGSYDAYAVVARGTTVTGSWALRISRDETPPSRTRRTGP